MMIKLQYAITESHVIIWVGVQLYNHAHEGDGELRIELIK